MPDALRSNLNPKNAAFGFDVAINALLARRVTPLTNARSSIAMLRVDGRPPRRISFWSTFTIVAIRTSSDTHDCAMQCCAGYPVGPMRANIRAGWTDSRPTMLGELTVQYLPRPKTRRAHIEPLSSFGAVIHKDARQDVRGTRGNMAETATYDTGWELSSCPTSISV